MRYKKIVLFSIFVILLLLASYLLFFRRSSSIKTSNNPPVNQNTDIEINNSYLFASPLGASANGAEKVRITFFILSNIGTGVEGQVVRMNNIDGVVVDEIQMITDAFGRAIFDVSTSVAGEYFFQGSVNNKGIPQRVRDSCFK